MPLTFPLPPSLPMLPDLLALLAPLPAAQDFQVFDTAARWGGGAGPLVLLVLAGKIIVHMSVAAYLYSSASRLRSEGRGPALFPPSLWGLIPLLGSGLVPIFTAFLFMALHYSDRFQPDLLTAWTDRGLGPKPSSSVHRDRVAELQAELEELRRHNRDHGGPAPGDQDTPPGAE